MKTTAAILALERAKEAGLKQEELAPLEQKNYRKLIKDLGIDDSEARSTKRD